MRAIVTGAAARGPGVGTGKATAILFGREGAKVLLVNRTESHARHLQREIEQEGGECAVCAAGVTKAAELEKMVGVAGQRYGSWTFWSTMSGSARRALSSVSPRTCGTR